jgi:hypothetical protein
MEIEEALRDVAFHALGIRTTKKPWPPEFSRNHYAAQEPPPAMIVLLEAGYVVSRGKKPEIFGDLEFWRVTEAGIRAARVLHAKLWKQQRLGTWEVFVRGRYKDWNERGEPFYEYGPWEEAGQGTGTSRSKARYDAYLRLSDPLPDLKIHEIKVGRKVA